MGRLFATETFKAVFAGMFLAPIGIDIDSTEHFFDEIDTLRAGNIRVAALGTFALDLCFIEVSNHEIRG
jgi:TctA family transporter